MIRSTRSEQLLTKTFQCSNAQHRFFRRASHVFKKQNNTLKRPNSVREKSINLRVTTAFIAHNSYTNGEIYFGHCRWCGGDISRERVRRTRRWCDLKTAIVVRKQFKRLQKQNEKKPRLLQRDRFAGRKKKKKIDFRST